MALYELAFAQFLGTTGQNPAGHVPGVQDLLSGDPQELLPPLVLLETRAHQGTQQPVAIRFRVHW